MPLGSAPSPADWPAERDDHPTPGETAATISNELVRLLRRHTGRGPTKAKTTLSPDLVVTTLTGCLTTAETRLASAGHGELVDRARHELHRGMGAEAIAIVEESTHRSVSAFLSDQNHDPDVAIIVFIMAPSGLSAVESQPERSTDEPRRSPPHDEGRSPMSSSELIDALRTHVQTLMERLSPHQEDGMAAPEARSA